MPPSPWGGGTVSERDGGAGLRAPRAVFLARRWPTAGGSGGAGEKTLGCFRGEGRVNNLGLFTEGARAARAEAIDQLQCATISVHYSITSHARKLVWRKRLP